MPLSETIKLLVEVVEFEFEFKSEVCCQYLIHRGVEHSIMVILILLMKYVIIVIIVQILDYYIPIWGTKKFGGSKRGVWGSSLGLIAGLFAGPWGIILGPFVGALLGELSANKSNKEALRAAFGAFVGFLLGTISKLIVAGFLIYYYFEALI